MAYQLLTGGDRSGITARMPNGAMQQALHPATERGLRREPASAYSASNGEF